MTNTTQVGAEALWKAGGAMRWMPRPFRVFFERRTWAELLYALVGLFQGIFGFVFTVTSLSVSLGLAITFVGLPLMALTGLASRHLGFGMRAGGNLLLGDDIPPPPPFVGRPGLLGWIRACLTDGASWRARLYLVLKLPLGILSFVVGVTFYAYGLGGVTYSIWRPFLPCAGEDFHHICHRGAQLGPHTYLDTWRNVVLVTLISVPVLLLAPLAVRGAVKLDRAAVRALLGPTSTQARLATLQRSRAVAVDDAATTLRRIERDLHDGAQARLVALAMNVGLAREKLAEGGDPAEAQQLLDAAHATAKDAIVELRELARGIHPPVLDAGLDTALQTLVSRSAIPATLICTLPVRPQPAIETIAYFCAAELLTNAAKHSGARRVGVDLREAAGRLVLTVTDDGRGGAHLGLGTGLAGLAERVSTVDGRLLVNSPTGGPTVITVELPLEVS